MKINYIILMCLLLMGCRTPNFTFPDDIKSQCYGTMNSSKTIIESTKQKKLNIEYGCRVSKVPGEKRSTSGWAFKSSNGKYALGSYNGIVIKIACNPVTGDEINTKVLEHEFAHYWVISNFGDWTHNPIYDGKFHNWEISRRMSGSSIEIENGRYIHVDYEE